METNNISGQSWETFATCICYITNSYPDQTIDDESYTVNLSTNCEK